MSSYTPQSLHDRLAIALDFPSAALALACVDRLEGTCRWMKVGLELYCAAGNPLVEALLNRNLQVFLDLKLHDIPNTVAAAVRSISNLGASLLTVHASGGAAMLEAAAEAAATSSSSPRLLAVTLLTSIDAEHMHAIGLVSNPSAHVLSLATLAASSGMPDLVCSAEEIALLRQHLGKAPILVVPGIRPIGADQGDQRRVATPAEALRRGASMLVVGRPITQAKDPAAAAQSILAEMDKSIIPQAHA